MMMAIVGLLLIIGTTMTTSDDITFSLDDLEDLRALIVAEITETNSEGQFINGLTIGHPLVNIFDEVADGFQPLLATLIRLAFHDCSGLNTESVNNPFNVYICDGCMKRDEPGHKGLFSGAVDFIEDICELFYDTGISRADCWSLSATIAIEHAANNTLNSVIRGSVGLDPTTVDILPGDIPYLVGRKDCEQSPFTDPDFEFEPFDHLQGWDVTSAELKERFGLANNREVVALIGGGHSVGRAHSRITGFIGAWDNTAEVLDNSYFETLLNRDPVSSLLGVNLDFYQAREIDNDRPDLVILNDNMRSNRNFLVDIPPHAQPIIFTQSPPRSRSVKYFNVDLSLAFDLRQYINDMPNNIACHTDAESVCQGKFVLIDGYEIDTTEEICEIKQCPLQCPDGNGGFQRFSDILVNDGLFNIDPNTDCIRAIFEEFATSNKFFTDNFVSAWTKMISTGYKDKNGETKLKVVGQSGSIDSESESNIPSRDSDSIDSSDNDVFFAAKSINTNINKLNATHAHANYNIIISLNQEIWTTIWIIITLLIVMIGALCYCVYFGDQKKWSY